MSEWDFCSSALPLIIQRDCEKVGFIFACSCFIAVTRVLWFCRCKANIMTLALCISSGDGESSFLVNREILMKMQLEEFFFTKKLVYPTVDALCLWCPGMQGKLKTMEMFYHLSFPPPPLLFLSWWCPRAGSTVQGTAATGPVQPMPVCALLRNWMVKANWKQRMTFSSGEVSCPRSYAASSGL